MQDLPTREYGKMGTRPGPSNYHSLWLPRAIRAGMLHVTDSMCQTTLDNAVRTLPWSACWSDSPGICRLTCCMHTNVDCHHATRLVFDFPLFYRFSPNFRSQSWHA